MYNKAPTKHVKNLVTSAQIFAKGLEMISLVVHCEFTIGGKGGKGVTLPIFFEGAGGV